MASEDEGTTGEHTHAPAIHISYPVNGSVETSSRFAVTGGILVPVFIHVRKLDADDIAIPLGVTYPLLLPGGPWGCSVVLGEGTHTIIAVAVGVDGYEIPSDRVTFSIRLALPAPQINQPEVDSTQDMLTWVSGRRGDYSAKVQILTDFDYCELGSALVLPTNNWGTFISFAPGMHSIVARQTINGRVGPVGTERLFKVRPFRLINIAVTPQVNHGVRFSGPGYDGATVEITVISGPDGASPPPAVTVSNGTWATTAGSWPLGVYRLSAIQKVTDNASGWIPSQPSEFDVSIVEDPVPDPTDVSFTYEQYIPSFFGRGMTGATVLITFANGDRAAPDAPVIGGIWSSRPTTDWGPTWKRQVQFKQQLDGQVSPGLVAVEVTIPPLPPVITGVVDDELSPIVSGTCWPGAQVELMFSNSPAPYSPVMSDGQWCFPHPDKFAPGVTHTVTVTQTMAQQTSPPARRTFEVGMLSKPVIIEPVHGAEVARDLRVCGTDSTNGATMQLRVDGIEAGPATPMSGGAWHIDLTGLAFGRRILDAQQFRGGRPSELSDPVAVMVVLMPPVFTVPLPGGQVPRAATIAGKGTPGAKVQVWEVGREDLLLMEVPVGFDGCWEGAVNLPVGVITLQARQTMEAQKEASGESSPVTCDVVPDAPWIETPVKDGEIGRVTVVSGFGEPGDTITISLDDAAHTVLGSTPVLEDRTWSVAVTLTQPAGAQALVAVASLDGFESDRCARQPVVLGSYSPVIDTPQAGRWVAEPVNFSGQGRRGTGQVTSWYNPEYVWAPALTVSTQGWQGWSVRRLSAGGNWCRFKQTIVDGADGSTISDWVQSQRFEVPGPTPR